jgi:ribosomal protein S18 acetylase RimI-like enzyme
MTDYQQPEMLTVMAGSDDIFRILRIYEQYSPNVLTYGGVLEAARQHSVFVVRTSEGTIVGFVTLVIYQRMKGLMAQIEDIVVDEAHRRQGIAKMLWTACRDSAKSRGCTKLSLMTYPNLEAANHFYLSLGMKKSEVNAYSIAL